MISEQLRTTLLSLKQISDRLKLLNTTSVTKLEALAYKNEIIDALGDIDFTEITEALDSIDEKIDDIATELGDVAQEATLGTSSDTSVSTTIFGWLKSIRDFLVEIVTTNPYAKETTVQQAASDAAAAKTAAQSITGYALQGSGNATQTDIASAIGTPATGQPSTLFAAIAAGGGGGDAQESTSQEILSKVQSLINNSSIQYNYNGLLFSAGYAPRSAFDVLNTGADLKQYLVGVVDEDDSTIPQMTVSEYPLL